MKYLFSKKRLFFHCVILFIFPLSAFSQRLPQGAVPLHYQLRFTPDFQNNTFSGEEVISIRLLRPSKSITLNAAEIKFNTVSVEVNRATLPAKAFLDSDRETANIIAGRPLPAGLVKLHISFTGVLNDQLRGFYLSTSGGRKYAVTQFEPTDARRAFPCFDEPDRKATFGITIIAPKSDTAISNSKIISDTPGPGAEQHTIQFAVTPMMSTYLVAMLVGQFECAEGAADGVPIRACGVPGKKDLGVFAVRAAEHFLHYYDHYFAMKYPWSKLDMIALPDFEAGAMENIGAITYRENALLIDEKHAS
ncbi:MAG TPA: M1 family metallopeptidase, partial [Terriglobales bacterium]